MYIYLKGFAPCSVGSRWLALSISRLALWLNKCSGSNIIGATASQNVVLQSVSKKQRQEHDSAKEIPAKAAQWVLSDIS